MIGLALLAAVIGRQAHPVLSWEGTAEVYPPGRTLRIAVRTSIDADGKVVSESWPVELDEATGLRRMMVSASGGALERGSDKRPMPADVWREERAQFGFYRQLQDAHALAADRARHGVTTFSVPGEVTTWFRVAPDGTLTGAVNEVPVGKGKTYQSFRLDGFWHEDGAIFPKRMEITRNGQPFFTLHVTRFDAR